jgi:hypothetical protein
MRIRTAFTFTVGLLVGLLSAFAFAVRVLPGFINSLLDEQLTLLRTFMATDESLEPLVASFEKETAEKSAVDDLRPLVQSLIVDVAEVRACVASHDRQLKICRERAGDDDHPESEKPERTSGQVFWPYAAGG